MCGPALVDAFRASVAADPALRDGVEVRGCSHVGGHKYAGNVLVFARARPSRVQISGALHEKTRAGSQETLEDRETACFGAWYGYVTPREIDDVLRRTVGRGEIVPRLWRGSMGMDPGAHEAAAAAAAAAAGEPWPPETTPCDACAENEKYSLGDIEDAGGANPIKKTRSGAVAGDVLLDVPRDSASVLERTFKATAVAAPRASSRLFFGWRCRNERAD